MVKINSNKVTIYPQRNSLLIKESREKRQGMGKICSCFPEKPQGSIVSCLSPLSGSLEQAITDILFY